MERAKNLKAVPATDARVTMLGEDAYRVDGLVRRELAEVVVLRELEDGERVAVVERWVTLGRVVDERSAAVADTDYLAREVDRLVHGVESSLGGEIRRRFDPNAEHSLTRPIVDSGAQVRVVLTQVQKQLEDLVKRSFDPNDTRSGVAKMMALVKEADQSIARRFDPERKDSVVAKLEGAVNDRLGELRKGMLAADGPFAALQSELQAIRVELARRDAADVARHEELAVSSRKGRVFEDELEPVLENLARAHGDTVERTGDRACVGRSKRGDFVITLAAGLGRVVIEARDGKIASLPKLLGELAEARRNRSADHAIAVVRDAADLPRQVGRFQTYPQGLVVGGDLVDVALRYVRGELALRQTDTELDVASIEQALQGVRAVLRRVRPVRANLGEILKASGKIEAEVDAMEEQLREVTAAIDDALRPDHEEGEAS